MERWSSSAAEGWSALQPSRGRTLESVRGTPDHHAVRGSGADWASFEANPFNAWGGRGAALRHDPPQTLALEPGAARWIQRPMHEYGGTQPRTVGPWGGHKFRHVQLGPNNPFGSDPNLDQMLDTYESQFSRWVPGHDANACGTSWPFPSGPEISSPSSTPWTLPSFQDSEDGSLQRSGSYAGSQQEIREAQSVPQPIILARTSSDLNRRRSMEISLSDHIHSGVEAECAGSRPLTLLLRKRLSVSDAGDLGRIIIPKKCAESQFQQIDTKEGTLLEMQDYDGSRRWFFRFKWWINNKSRMYVLENTGEFIKYHGLQEHDLFVVYADSFKNMVVRGHKGTDLDEPTLVVFHPDTAPGSSDPKWSASLTNEEGPSPTIALS